MSNIVLSRAIIPTEQIANNFHIYSIYNKEGIWYRNPITFSRNYKPKKKERLNPKKGEKSYYYDINPRQQIRAGNQRINYYIDEVNRIGQKTGINPNGLEIRNFLIKLVETKIIPERYVPKVVDITKTYFVKGRLTHDEWISSLSYYRVYKIMFSDAIISLLIQKLPQIPEDGIHNYYAPQTRKLIHFFQELTRQEGEDFDVYIDKWAKRLLFESNIKH